MVSFSDFEGGKVAFLGKSVSIMRDGIRDERLGSANGLEFTTAAERPVLSYRIITVDPVGRNEGLV